MDTSLQGPLSGTLTIASNAPDHPTVTINLSGEVAPPAFGKGDMDCNGVVDFEDINPFVRAITSYEGYHAAYPDCDWLNGDCNDDLDVNFDDIICFIHLLSAE